MRSITLTDVERLTLANQFRILAKLDPEEADEYRMKEAIVQAGYTAYYGELFEYISDELPLEVAQYIFDVLEMFSQLKHHYASLVDKAGIELGDVSFEGFDGNEDGAYLYFVEFLKRYRRFIDILGDMKDFNSHSVFSRKRYDKMLQRYQEVKARRADHTQWTMTKEELVHIVRGTPVPGHVVKA